VICHESQAGAILAFPSRRPPRTRRILWLAGNFRPLVESISERAIRSTGSTTPRSTPRRGAHQGDLVVHLNADKILFAGDVALNGRLPLLAQSPDVDPDGWVRVLQALGHVPVEKLVPGHGEIGSTKGVSESYAYVKAVDDMANKFVSKGLPEEQVDTQVHDPENAVPGLAMSDAHSDNVKASYRAIKEKTARASATPPRPWLPEAEVTEPAGLGWPSRATVPGRISPSRFPGQRPRSRFAGRTVAPDHRGPRSATARPDGARARVLGGRGLRARPRTGRDRRDARGHAEVPDGSDRDAGGHARRGLGRLPGGGAEIVSACDLVLVSEDARIGFPEIRLACFSAGGRGAPAGADRRGARFALDLTGESVSAAKRPTRGSPARGVARAPLEETERVAAQILSAAPGALSSALDLVRRSRREALANRLPDAEDAYRRLAGDADLARAVSEFGASRRR
jgi:hypothetical protein